jgi:hypothetical protein
VHCIGVAEGTLVDGDPEKVARFVGQRTVYSYDAISDMCRQGPVLAILFRHARTLGTPFDLASLVGNRALAVAPQSIVRVREEGRGWLRDRLVQWP